MALFPGNTGALFIECGFLASLPAKLLVRPAAYNFLIKHYGSPDKDGKKRIWNISKYKTVLKLVVLA